MQLRLYHYWRSSSSWRVRWALALKKIHCEFTAINLLTGENESPAHLLRNPMGFVPVLEIPNGYNSGDNSAKNTTDKAGKYLSESMAIIEWLDELHPIPALFSQDSFERARMRQLAEVINAGTQPVQNLEVLEYYSSDREKQKAWLQHWVEKGFQTYETLIADTAGLFSFGDQVTLPDLFLIPQCYNALRWDMKLESYPKILSIYQNAMDTAACQSAAPERYTPEKN